MNPCCEKRSRKPFSSDFALDKEGQKSTKPNQGMCLVGKPKMYLGTVHWHQDCFHHCFVLQGKKLLNILDVYFPNMAAAFLFNSVNAVESYL